MTFPWPDPAPRIPDAPWTRRPLEGLALGYDTVESHGWYRNLDYTLDQLDAYLEDGDLLLDYSGGTGILADRLLERIGERKVGILLVDSSPKFLRLALEKLRDDPRLAFRRIRYLRDEKRLETLQEALEPALLERGADALVSTNAMHLYYDLVDTLRSWRRLLVPGSRAFVQSGNIRNPEMAPDEWIIDETVESIHRAALEIVREEPPARPDRATRPDETTPSDPTAPTGGDAGPPAPWTRYREATEDEAFMEAHDELRRKYFLPVRPLSHYTEALEEAGFRILEVDRRVVDARVDEWYEFLSVYHEGVLGWVGGAEKVTGEAAPEEVVEDRLRLLREAMERIFGREPSFRACWTYLTCEPRP